MSTAVVRIVACDCGALVLAGDCDYGIDSRADVLPVSVVGEAAAVLTHRRTFDLVKMRGSWRLRSRSDPAIVARLTATDRMPETTSVLVEHACGIPLAASAERPSAVATVTPVVVAPIPAHALADAMGLPRPALMPPF